MKTSLFCPLQPRTSWLMLVADGGWGMLPITMYARTKWLTKLAVFTYPHGEQSIYKKCNKPCLQAENRKKISGNQSLLCAKNLQILREYYKMLH